MAEYGLLSLGIISALPLRARMCSGRRDNISAPLPPGQSAIDLVDESRGV
jgi:hypothetical protein